MYDMNIYYTYNTLILGREDVAMSVILSLEKNPMQ